MNINIFLLFSKLVKNLDKRKIFPTCLKCMKNEIPRKKNNFNHEIK